jgi:hypothetical protein
MPGSVENAAPSAVLPQSLCRVFVQERAYPLIENEYRDGESQRAVLADGSRRSWRLVKRLTAAQLAELRAFYEARQGPTEPFSFYDPYQTIPKFSWDPTSQATQGRYTVRFNNQWSQSVGTARPDVQIEIIEVA